MTTQQIGIIYCLKDSDHNIFYIGSTTTPLEERLYYHKYETNKGLLQFDLYKHTRTLEDFSIELLEEFVHETRKQLYRQEGIVIRRFLNEGKALKNMIIPGQTQKEYYANNPEKFLQWKANTYENRTKKVKCECGAEVSNANFSTHLKTRQHLSYFGQTHLSYDCECGKTDLDFNNRSHHERTKHHLTWLGEEDSFTKSKQEEYTCVCGKVLKQGHDITKIKRHEQSQQHKYFLLSPEEKKVIDDENEEKRKVSQAKRAKYKAEWHQRNKKKST